MATNFELETRRLVLSTALITGGVNPAMITTSAAVPASYSSVYGSSNGTLTQMTFRVPLRKVIGDDWARKYRNFGIRLKQWAWSPRGSTAGFGATVNDSCMNLVMRSDMIKWRWQTRTNAMERSGVMTTYIQTGGQQGINNFSNDSNPTITLEWAGQEWVDFNFEWLRTVDNGAFQFTTAAGRSYAFPTTQFGFEIIPMPEDEDRYAMITNNTKQRK